MLTSASHTWITPGSTHMHAFAKKKNIPVLNESVTKRTDRALSRETQENSFDNWEFQVR